MGHSKSVMERDGVKKEEMSLVEVRGQNSGIEC